MFEITLTNFRCHIQKTITIPEKGLILLKGNSGIGKSTIFAAFIFAFYGKGTGLSNYENQEKGCSVNIKSSSYEIFRSTKPKKLIVTNSDGVSLTSDKAQSYIEERILNSNSYDDFCNSSFSEQGRENSVISLPANDQLNFIQNHCCKNNSSNKNKQKIDLYYDHKNELKKTSEIRLATLKGQLECFSSESTTDNIIPKTQEEIKIKIQELQKSSDELTHEIDRKKGRVMESLKREVIDLQKRIKLYEEDLIKITELDRKKENLLSRLSDIPILQSDEILIIEKKSKLTELFANILKSKLELDACNKNKQQFLDSLNSVGRDDKLEELKSKTISEEELSILINSNKIAEDRYKEFLGQFTKKKDSERKISELLESLMKFLSSTGIKDFRTSKSTISSINKKLKEISLKSEEKCKELEIEINKNCIKDHIGKTFDCPKCSCKVRVKNEVLEEVLEVPSEIPDIPEKENVLSDRNKTNKLLVDQLREVSKKIENFFAVYESEEPNLSNKITETMIKNYEKEYQAVNGKLVDINNVFDEIKKLENESLKNEHLTKVNFDNKISKVQNDIEMKINTLKNYELMNCGDEIEKMSGIEVKFDEIKNKIESLNSYCVGCSNQINNFYEVQNKRLSLEKDLSVVDKQIETFGSDSFEIQAKIINSKEEFDKIEIRKQEVSEEILNGISEQNKNLLEIQQMKLYLIYLEKLEKYNKTKEQLDETENVYKMLEAELLLIAKMKTIHKNAELLSIDKFVENINVRVENYFDELFKTGEKLKVELSTTKELSSGVKFQISVKCQQKGVTFNNINHLSGGEKQRVYLSFLLALNEMLKSPFVFLDECLNNLDSEVNTMTLNMLRDKFSTSKLILVISHEAQEGIFDEVVEV